MKKGIIFLALAFFTFGLIAGCGNNGSETGVVGKSETMPSQQAGKAAGTVTTTASKAAPVAQKVVPTVYEEELLVADFDSGEKPSNIGGNFGAWDKDPSDFSQGCKEGFDSVNRIGSKGFAMKLDYDVDSSNPAYNGFWMLLPNLDGSSYDNLSFWIKGDSENGYTTVLKTELKNAARQTGRYYVTNVTEQWQEVVIPLSDFKGLTDLSNLTEFVIVFEDRVASNKDGVIYIEDIKFTK